MSPMRFIILAVAALAAVIAAILVRNLAGQTGPANQTTETVEVIKEVEVSQTKVLVARHDLIIGSLLTPDDLAWSDWPERSVNPNFFTQESHPEAIEEITGSVVRAALYSEEPVLPMKIVQKGETGFMAALLRPGMRAATVEISPELASAGFILPDDRVDVILTYQVEVVTKREVQERTLTKTIMENARVLAIDQTFGEVDGVPAMTGSTATLELNQQQAELMALAASMGQISLTLRSVADADWNDGEVKAQTDMLESLESGGNEVTIFRNGSSVGGGA
ncbi:MAG: Flp pilus assembly protein CpaB [Pseudomonadota bacterium]